MLAASQGNLELLNWAWKNDVVGKKWILAR